MKTNNNKISNGVKKLIFILILLVPIFLPKICSAALAATTVWELRATATANNVNGGGFDSALGGTDYSQQTAAQLALSDLYFTSGTTLISATGGFTALMVGNIIHITSGTHFYITTAAGGGWYEIATYVDTNTVTLDRAPASEDTSAHKDAVGKVGGAISLNSTLDSDFFSATVAGNTIWVKYGSLSLGEDTSGASGSALLPIVIEGYNTTRGDTPIGSNRPTINNLTHSFGLGGVNEIRNIIFTGTGSYVLKSTANAFRISNCKVTNTSTTAGRNAIYSNYNSGVILNNEVISYRGYAIYSNDKSQILYNYIHDSNIGIYLGYTDEVVIGNIIESNVTYGIQIASFPVTIIGNTIYGSEAKTGTGISMATGIYSVNIFNNIIYGFATGVSAVDAGAKVYLDYNDYYNNTTNRTNVATGAHDQAVAPSFTSVAQVTGTTAHTQATSVLHDAAANFANVVNNQDFCYVKSGTGVTAGQYLITAHDATTLTLSPAIGENATADKVYQVTTGRNFAIGTGLKALGFPGLFQAGLTQGFMDIGAAQRQEQAVQGTIQIKGGMRIQ